MRLLVGDDLGLSVSLVPAQSLHREVTIFLFVIHRHPGGDTLGRCSLSALSLSPADFSVHLWTLHVRITRVSASHHTLSTDLCI